jgi:hypothetical protein
MRAVTRIAVLVKIVAFLLVICLHTDCP